MNGRRFLNTVVAVGLAVAVPLSAWAGESAAGGDGKGAAASGTAARASGPADRQAEKERAKILEEAVGALAKTKLALRQLDGGHREQAIDTLSRVIGKLEVITARDPELALAPVDVRFVNRDFYHDVQSVEEAVGKVEDLLDDDRIQQARAILSDLGSEIVVRVVNIPLATYPAAIKAIVPLIDSGRIDAAKAALQDVLSTLVVVDHVVPLPVLRAETLLAEARRLAAKSERNDEEDARLGELLASARHELELAEALGYGDRDDYRAFYQSLKEIGEKVAGGGSEGGDLFDRLRRQLDDLLSSLA